MWGINYLDSTKKQFIYYKSLADKAIASVPDSQLYWIAGDGANSIGTLVQHISGNMLSRFTDFLTPDGEKPWRDREHEFLPQHLSRETLLTTWEDAWQTLFTALSTAEHALDAIVYIRNEGHTVMEAINRQLPHYGYHIGQLVYIAKLLNGNNWQSLSIAKGESEAYNSAKFSKEPTVIHYIDVIMDQPLKIK